MASKASRNGLVTKKTRLLLMLWDMTEGQSAVKKSELTGRAKKSREKVGDYTEAFADLEKAKAIAHPSKLEVSITEKGKKLLDEGLRDPRFAYDSQIGARTANTLLKWIRQQNGNGKMDGVVPVEEPKKTAASKIESYEAFKPVALEAYEHLNRDYNYDNLVPIYQIRREIGDRISRSQFNEWLLEMQSNDILQLIGGEMPELTPDKAKDSIKTALGGVRYYAKCI